MRSRVLALLIANLLLLPAYPQTVGTKEMSDREEDGLHGPVKRCTEHRTYHSQSSQPEQSTTHTTGYDPAGNLLLTTYSNPDGSHWNTRYTYDEQHRLISRSSGKGNETTFESTYSYDSSGRLTRIHSRPGDPEARYEYANGQKRKIEKPQPNLPPDAARSWSWEGSSLSFGLPDEGTITTLYDDRDRPITGEVRDASGQLVGRIHRTYDQQGHALGDKSELINSHLALPDTLRSQLNEAQLKSVGNFIAQAFSGEVSNRYDQQGRLTEERQVIGTETRITTYAYNDHNDKTEELVAVVQTALATTDFSLDDQGNMQPSTTKPATPYISEIHYAYEYDDYGNWTRQTITDRFSPDAPLTPRATLTRELTYY